MNTKCNVDDLCGGSSNSALTTTVKKLPFPTMISLHVLAYFHVVIGFDVDAFAVVVLIQVETLFLGIFFRCVYFCSIK